ncbi:hypothetical protein PC123_g9114 [Phytophthora cactorum]|nr:hypothetical protein PC122_g9647 [Phytophthora cactorum]KAG4055803.1 hypothetical protein PC123_g9114 [Phytophthora cactorum]
MLTKRHVIGAKKRNYYVGEARVVALEFSSCEHLALVCCLLYYKLLYILLASEDGHLHFLLPVVEDLLVEG